MPHVLRTNDSEDETIRILLVEDNKGLCDAIKLQLERAGYEIDCCGQGQGAFYYVVEYLYDVAILDRMLLHMGGLSVLGGSRRINITTLVITTTALDGINDRIDGLGAGADDYLMRSYAAGELLAKIRVLTRRPGNFKQSPASACSSISLNPERKELTGPQGAPQLNKRESALIGYLIRNADQVPPSGLILPHTWGPDSDVEGGNLDNYIYPPGRHFKSIGALPQIKTAHGIGYRLENGGTYD